MQLAESLVEQIQFAIGLQSDLQFSQVHVLRVAEFPEQSLIHDFCKTLVPHADSAIHRDIEDDRLKRNPGGDRIEQAGDPLVCNHAFENCGSSRVAYGFVGDGVSENFGEGRFAGAKKARHPHPDALPWLGRPLRDLAQHINILILDRVRSDIFFQLCADGGFIDLIDLDDFFNGSVDGPLK